MAAQDAVPSPGATVSQVAQILEQGSGRKKDDTSTDAGRKPADKPHQGQPMGIERDAGTFDDPDPDAGQDNAGAEGAEDGDLEAERQAGQEKPLSLKELAAELGVDAKAIYEVEIPLGEGKKMSLGELKDLAKQAEEHRGALEKLQAVETDRSNEIMLARRELSTMMQALGENIDPVTVRAVQEMNAKTLQRERTLMMRAIPEWSDPLVIAADRKIMVDFLAQYGFNEMELGQVADHRLIKLLRDTAKGHAAASAAKQQASKPPKHNAPSPATRTAGDSLRTLIQRAKAPGSRPADKAAAIGALLK